MTLKKCDRCGEVYAFVPASKTEDSYQLRKKYPTNLSSAKVIDLCPSCKEELKHWFEDHKEA